MNEYYIITIDTMLLLELEDGTGSRRPSEMMLGDVRIVSSPSSYEY